MINLASVYTVRCNDAMVFLLFGCAFVYIYWIKGIYVRGFSCDDATIRMPYRPLTVGLAQIIAFSTVLPSLVIFYTEHIAGRQPGKRLKRFWFAICANLLMTLYFKSFVGRLRPHFIDVCRPNVNCSEPGNVGRWVEDYECLNESLRAVRQTRQSFFSGHASISMNAAVYLIVFVQQNYEKSLLKAFVQLFLLLLGLYPGITQINNFWVGFAISCFADLVITNFHFFDLASLG